ncbi:MAG TPA: hypothetical protein P5114_05740 [Hyphomicrobiaceae bacterium]|nr:hypothetical protein [Hyphomicrobiaceae bacterium]
MKQHIVFSALALALAAIGGTITQGSSAFADAKKKISAPTKITDVEQAAISSGVLSQQDVKLNCKRMAGQMQIRILENRGGGANRKSSSAAQGLQSAVVPFIGGTHRGTDAAGDRGRDLAKLDAMNRILIARSCPHYDLQAELKMDHSARTPRLIRPGQKAPKRRP